MYVIIDNYNDSIYISIFNPIAYYQPLWILILKFWLSALDDDIKQNNW